MPELDTDYGIDLLGKVTKGYALRNLMQENQMNEARMADLPGVLAHEKTIQGQTETLGSQQIARGKREAELEPLLKLQHTYELTTKVMGDMTEANYDQKRDFLMNVVPPGVAQVKIPTKTEAMAEAAGRKLTLDELLKEKYMTIAQQLELTTKQTNKLVAEKELATAGKEKAKQIRSVDVGDKVEIYEDGVLVKTVKKGKTPKDEKPEKPEYSPKQALSRISTIDATIARMKSSGTVDTGMAIQNPALAMLVDTKDPEAVKQAIASLQTERDYVSGFAPKGKGVPKSPPKTEEQKKVVIPKGAETGTYNGERAYKVNGKFFSIKTGLEIK